MTNNRTTAAGSAARGKIAAIFAKALLRLVFEGEKREEIAQIAESELDKESEARLRMPTSTKRRSKP